VKNNMLSGYEESYEVTALRKDGTTFPCEIQALLSALAQEKSDKKKIIISQHLPYLVWRFFVTVWGGRTPN
jgi:hypothetical protein